MKFLKFLLYLPIPVIVFGLSSYLTISILLKTQQTALCPDVRGKTVEEAKNLVAGKGLSLSILRYERRNDVPYGHVTVQKPDANINTRKGRVVYVIVSEGPEMIKTPGLVGMTLENAEETLTDKQLALDRTINVPDPRAGKVLAQIPAEGTEILQMSNITLFVGAVENTWYLVPDTRKMDMREFIQELNDKKIKYKVRYVRGDEFSQHSSFDLSLPAGTLFSGADELTINVY